MSHYVKVQGIWKPARLPVGESFILFQKIIFSTFHIGHIPYLPLFKKVLGLEKRIEVKLCDRTLEEWISTSML